jgi:pSer/pThr/pTyr-binding forkhead associated (FHA) protein
LAVSRFLLATTGINAGSLFVLGRSTTLGRSPDVTISVMDPQVSRQHACLEPDQRGNMVLSDLSSSNGTYVGNKRMVRRVLRSGERFRIGSSEFLFGEVHAEVRSDESLEEAVYLISARGVEATGLIADGLQTLRRKAQEDENGDISETADDHADEPVRGPADTRTRDGDCTDPLHELASWRGWPHCPACGRAIES